MFVPECLLLINIVVGAISYMMRMTDVQLGSKSRCVSSRS